MNPAEHSVFPFYAAGSADLPSTLRLKDPAVERERSRVAIAIGFPMPHQPFVAAAPMSYTAVEVFAALGDLAGEGAIPRSALIFDVKGSPQVTCQSKLGRRCGLEVSVTDDRLGTRDPRVRVDIVIGLDDPTRKDVAAGKIRPLARIERLTEPATTEHTLETEALIRTVKEQLAKIITLGKVISPEVMVIVENMQEPGSLADLIASNIGLKVEAAQGLLEIIDPIERLKRVNEFLNKEFELLSMQARIQSAAKEEMGKSQREYYLREQLRAIQQELGETDARSEEIAELRKAIESAKMPSAVEKETLKQFTRGGGTLDDNETLAAQLWTNSCKFFRLPE